MLKRGKRVGFFSLAVVVLMLAGLLAVNMSAAAWAKAETVIGVDPTDDNAVAAWKEEFSESRIPIVYSERVTVEMDETKAEFDENKKVILLKRPDNWDNTKFSGSAENIGTVTFNEVGTIGNRKIDVKIKMDKISIVNGASALDENGKILIATFRGGNELWFGGWDHNGCGYYYHGNQIMDITTDIVYSDDKSPVDLSVIHLIQDLDMGGNEGVRTIEGYTNKYYRFSNSNWTISDAVEGELDVTSKVALHGTPEYNSVGWSELTVGGVFLETKGGSFKSELRTYGSGIVYDLYSQYLNIDDATNPYKEIVDEKTEAYVAGEEVTFDVAHTMFNWNETFTKYTKLSIYDNIPEGLDYVSAEVLDGDGNTITDEGTLIYQNRTVTFNFDRAWLDDLNNYNGKDVTLRIVTKVTGDPIGTIKNIGHVDINGIEMDTNEVDIEVIPPPTPDPDPRKEIVNGKTEAYVAGEEVTFDVAFTMFEWYENAVKYDSLSVYDNIPEGLEYVSAKVLDGDGNDITADVGTLSVEGNKVTFTFNPDWLGDEANYNGKDVTLRIVTKVTGDPTGTIKNIGYINVDGVDMDTNEVEIEVEEPEETTTTPEETTAPEETTTPGVTVTTPNFSTVTPASTLDVVVITSKPVTVSVPTETLDLGAGVIDTPAEEMPTQNTVYWMAIVAVIALAAAGTVSAVRRKNSK